MGYKKCSRCDLNYISDEEELCFVCKAQLHIGDAKLLEDEDDEFLEICPVCHINFISEDEEMCQSCRSSKLKNVFVKEEDESDDNWRTYLDEETPEEDDILIPLSEIAEEEEANEWDGEQEFEDEENKPVEDDFDDFVDFDVDGDEEEDDDDDEDDEDETE
jgi:hypothetical protein